MSDLCEFCNTPIEKCFCKNGKASREANGVMSLLLEPRRVKEKIHKGGVSGAKLSETLETLKRLDFLRRVKI